MQKIRFEEAAKLICKEDNRYTLDGYRFLRDALDHTVKSLRGEELEEHRHVSGPELLHGVVEYALKEFGSMSVPVLETWGITAGDDIGEMVFNLIHAGAFGRSEEDSPADFQNVIDLRAALLAPYRPTRPVLSDGRAGVESNGNEPPARGNQPAKSSEV